MCTFFQRSICKKRDSCDWSHGEDPKTPAATYVHPDREQMLLMGQQIQRIEDSRADRQKEKDAKVMLADLVAKAEGQVKAKAESNATEAYNAGLKAQRSSSGNAPGWEIPK